MTVIIEGHSYVCKNTLEVTESRNLFTAGDIFQVGYIVHPTLHTYIQCTHVKQYILAALLFNYIITHVGYTVEVQNIQLYPHT